jgi:hypothetical protein
MDLRTNLEQGLKNKATTRTLKYVCDKSNFSNDVADIVYTYNTVKAKLRNSEKIEIDGEEYFVGEYRFPTKLVECCKAARVYVTTDSISYAKPYFVYVAEKPTVVNGYEPKLLTPMKVSSFWDRYNENQGDKQITLSVVSFEEGVLSNFSALLTEDGKHWVHWNDGGELNEFVAMVNGIVFPMDEEYVETYRLPNNERVQSWLVSLDKE